MKPHLLYKSLSLGTFALSFLLAGCEPGWDTSDGGTATPTPTVPGDLDPLYVGLGSSWRLELDDEANQFTLTKHDVPDGTLLLDASGSYQELQSGFTELIFNTVSTGTGISAGDKRTLLITGSAVVISEPMESASKQLQAMVNADTCSENDLESNWLLYKQADNFNIDEDDAHHFGRFIFTVGNNAATIARRSLDDELSFNSLTSSTDGCTDGNAVGSNYRFYLTLSNSASVEIAENEDSITAGNSANSQFLLVLERSKILATSNFNGTYIGFYSDSNDDSYMAIQAECTDGTCTFQKMTDLENGSLDPDNIYNLDLATESVDDPEDGMLVGKVTLPDETTEGKVVCSINNDYADSGDKSIACVGTPPGSTTLAEITNIFLRSK
ncbi:hypothetical protein P886_1822 [Alteromonadaceae bacterium 2753L.S.0a.02]|nr:hypothetical protein P886_1822 [Alteromonadaceae bacterium 2753L.S.0a.02]